MGGRRSDSGGGFAGVFIFLVLLGIVIEYIWWILGGVVLAAGLYGIWWWLQHAEKQREEAAELAREREKDLQIRADRQHRWELIGDSRGVYGPDGAAAMRRVTDDDAVDLDGHDADAPVAAIARTPDELAALRAERPHQWRWALFASILLQRREALLPRLRDSELGFVSPTAVRVYSADALADRIYGLVDRLLSTLQQIDAFIAAPGFMAAFGIGDGKPDADAIEHIANRLMDYHLRLLELSEDCRDICAPSAYSDALRDCARVLHDPLENYRQFIDEFVEVVEAFPRILAQANGTIDLGGIALDLTYDNTTMARLMKRLKELSPP